MNRLVLAALVLAGAAGAESAEDLLFRARHAQEVRGDLRGAIELYKRALEDAALDTARQAEAHLRIALCLAELGDAAAHDHLAESLFARAEVPASLRRHADEVRAGIRKNQPRPRTSQPETGEDAGAARARRLEEHLRQARAALDRGDDVRAYVQIQAAIELDPASAEARRLEGEVDTRLSGVADFVRDPLRFVKAWTEAQTKAVAREAEELLKEALRHERAKAYNLARTRFREAVATIDRSELARESLELIDLRERILHRWRGLEGEGFGPTEPEADRPRTTFVADYLNHLQRMLDVISAPGQEYRIIPVGGVRGAAQEWRTHGKPAYLQLLRHLPSRWSPALFARRYVPLRVHSSTWSGKGNYLEAVGGMLVARNRPPVLDDVVREVRRIEAPPGKAFRARFVLVSVPLDALPRFASQFGEWRRAEGGDSPVLYRAIPQGFGLEQVCDHLRDEGANVRPERDAFDVEVGNGAAQTFFAAERITRAVGCESLVPDESDALVSHFGLLLDACPLRNEAGQQALLLGLSARLPLPPLDGRPRFLTQTADLFVDLAPGATLAVAGLADPFAAGRGEHDPNRVLLLLWENTRAGEEPAPEQGPLAGKATAEVPVRDLLLRVRDLPGPMGNAESGFVRREPLAVLEERGRFLVNLLRDQLGPEAVVDLDVEEAVVRVPAELRDAAAAAVEDLQAQGRSSFVVRVQARAVRTPVFERWMLREGLALHEFGGVSVAFSDAPSGEFLLRNLVQTEPDDVFAPSEDLPALTVLGLQARHVLSARLRTSPSWSTDEDLPEAETRTVTEGLCVSVRPYRWRGRLLAEVGVETQGLQSEVEELALSQAVPSYRTVVSGTSARGTVDLGDPAQPRTALLCRIPHPTSSSLENLTELVVAISVRPVP